MNEYDYSERNDELVEELGQLEWCLEEIEWDCPECGESNVDSWLDTTFPYCSGCEVDFEWNKVLDENILDSIHTWEKRTEDVNAKLLNQPCPLCGEALSVSPGYVLKEHWDSTRHHRVASISTGYLADENSQQAVRFQIASNLAAYVFDADAHVDLGVYGQMWVQCHTKRDRLGPICWEK